MISVLTILRSKSSLQLAATRGVAGVGVWSADGVAATTAEGKQIWDIFAQYVTGEQLTSVDH